MSRDGSTRQTFVVSYDISDPKRLRKVYRLMNGYGDWVQLSVFRCELTPREVLELRAKLGAIIHHGVDQVLFVDVGPADGRSRVAFRSLGRPYAAGVRQAIVV